MCLSKCVLPHVCRGGQSLEGLRPLGTEITGGRTPSDVCSEEPSPLKEQEVLLTIERPLQPNAWDFYLSTENQTQLALYRMKRLYKNFEAPESWLLCCAAAPVCHTDTPPPSWIVSWDPGFIITNCWAHSKCESLCLSESPCLGIPGAESPEKQPSNTSLSLSSGLFD